LLCPTHWGHSYVASLKVFSSVADPDPGSGIRYLFDPWIRDLGWEKVSIRIRDEQPGSYFLELRNNFFAFFGVKILKLFDEDPGSGMETVRIWDGKKSDPGSGINITDPQQWFLGMGWFSQGHNIQGTLCQRGAGATSKSFWSGTHRSLVR
jgi:hypothetical protein